MKRMSRFLPSARCPVEQADGHYERVHHRFAMRMFREHAPTVSLYATNHAVARLDLAGTFQQRPDAWRFVILEIDDPPAAAEAGGKEWLPAWAEQAIVQDHTNFLREVRPFEVTPTIVVERRTTQTTLVKYLVECEAQGEDTTDAAEEAYARLWEAVGDVGSDAFGLRLAVANRVVREAEMQPVIEPGQAYAGRYLTATSMRGFGELYFDHHDWAEEFFRLPPVRSALSAMPGVRLAAYRVDELIGVDRR